MKIEDFVKSGEKTGQLASFGCESRFVVAVGDPDVFPARTVRQEDVQAPLELSRRDYEHAGITSRVVAHRVGDTVEVQTLWLFDDADKARRSAAEVNSLVFDVLTSKIVNVTEITR